MGFETRTQLTTGLKYPGDISARITQFTEYAGNILQVSLSRGALEYFDKRVKLEWGNGPDVGTIRLTAYNGGREPGTYALIGKSWRKYIKMSNTLFPDWINNANKTEYLACDYEYLDCNCVIIKLNEMLIIKGEE